MKKNLGSLKRTLFVNGGDNVLKLLLPVIIVLNLRKLAINYRLKVTERVRDYFFNFAFFGTKARGSMGSAADGIEAPR
jgi:hypothetical protein